MKPQSDWGLQDWLHWQEQLHARPIDLGLERVAAVAARLQLPASGITTLTVGGTNGKGSSATLAALIYRAAGYRTGLYTSPHLLHYRERVSVDGVCASDADFCRAFAAIEAVRGEIPLTYFEFGTLAALWLFREAGVAVQVLEVGLGGRLDAVNLVDADAALVTSIGLDHTDWLGPDRDSIGYEKAGIYRSGRPAICADPSPPARLCAQARALNAVFQRIGSEFSYARESDGWCWRSGSAEYHLPLPELDDDTQLQNASGVIAAVQALQPQRPVPVTAIRAALPQLRLPGRWQRLGAVTLDVAHNAEAMAVLVSRLRAAHPARPPAVVLGMLADKPVEAVEAVLAPLGAPLYLASLPGPRGLPAENLARRLQAHAGRLTICADVSDALLQARRQHAHVVVTGSFLTVAAALEFLKSEPGWTTSSNDA